MNAIKLTDNQYQLLNHLRSLKVKILSLRSYLNHFFKKKRNPFFAVWTDGRATDSAAEGSRAALGRDEEAHRARVRTRQTDLRNATCRGSLFLFCFLYCFD